MSLWRWIIIRLSSNKGKIILNKKAIILKTTLNMDKKKIHYCFTLLEKQMKFLRSKKYKIDRMECFLSLATLAEREPKLVQLSKTQQVKILVGQFIVDNTQLAKLWDKDRKTVPKLLEAMEALDISSSQKVGEVRIHTLHSLAGWYVDAKFKGNPFALKRNNDETSIVHAEVPAAKVIVIEDEENADSKNKDTDEKPSDKPKSSDGNEGKISPVDGTSNGNKPQSNDSGDMGKISADGKPSDSNHEGTSPSGDGIRNSADNSSSSEGIDGKQNEGKEEKIPQEQSGGQQPHNNWDGKPPYQPYQKPNGNGNPNDYQNDNK